MEPINVICIHWGERVICVSNSVKDYVLTNYPKSPRKNSQSSTEASIQ